MFIFNIRARYGNAKDKKEDSDMYPPNAYATIHKNTLVVCYECFSRAHESIEVRFISVCLEKCRVVSDVTHSIGEGFTHLWIERQMMETGRGDFRQEILHGKCHRAICISNGPELTFGQMYVRLEILQAE